VFPPTFPQLREYNICDTTYTYNRPSEIILYVLSGMQSPSRRPPLTCAQGALLGNPRLLMIRVYELLLFAAINTPCQHSPIMVPYPPMKSKYTTDEPTAYQIT
jgi:hypothetical protein